METDIVGIFRLPERHNVKRVFALGGVLLTYAVLMAAMGVANTTSALAAASVASGWAGVVMGLYYVGFVCGALIVGQLVGAIGRTWALPAFAVVLALFTGIQSVNESALVWAVCRFGSGIGMVGVFVCIESGLNREATNRLRGRVLGLYMATSYLGDAAGQFLLGASLTDTSSSQSIAALALLVTAIALSWFRAISTGQRESGNAATSIWRAASWLLASRPQGLASVLVAGFLVGGHFSSSPEFLKLAGYDSPRLLALMGWCMCAALLFQFPVGRLADHVGRVPVMRLSLALLAGAAILLYACFPRESGGFLFSLSVGLTTTLYTTAVAFVNDGMPEDVRLSSAALLLATYSLGASLGPPVLRFAMEHGEVRTFFAVNGVLCVLALLPWLRREESGSRAGGISMNSIVAEEFCNGPGENR